MSPTGWPMMVTAIVLAVAAPIGTYLLWNRIRGPRPVRAATRLSMIGVSQVMAILLCGVIVNNYYGLYASWDDLLGDTGSPGVIIHENTVAAGGPITGSSLTDGTAQGGRGQAVPVVPRSRPPGPVQEFKKYGDDALVTSFTGPRSGLGGSNDVITWLPPQYNDPAYANTAFPVVLLFPGYPGTPQTWFGNMAGQKELGALIQQHSATPFVLVAVNISPVKGVNTDCTDIPGGPQVATFITDDIRNMVERTFRVTTDRTGWGMMGYSEGGLCAGKLLVQYPQLFSAAVQMSGDVRPGGYVSKYGSAFADQNSTLWVLQNHKPNPPVSLLAAASAEDDHGSVLAAAESLQQVAPDMVDVLKKEHGSHNTAVWKQWLPQAYGWLSQHLEQVRPQS
ncbi:alpha/beta hydrolase [Catenulispora pinisilvae]|uniref:alpha/beta hydrolase n=1 Tax=Catenulispora pinisilvae TaxID=2705253 RepID=UPI0018925316|nr:alpha/beta hydrolase-fold protein [Catenulispora pinisilvae]